MKWYQSTFSIAVDSPPTMAFRISPAAPAKRIVLAVHGAGNDALFGWIGLFKQLLEAQSEVFTFDLPGHGRGSDTRFDPDEIGDWMRAALDSCTRSAAHLPVHAIGVSLGGAILLSRLPELQSRLASAALVVAPLRIQLSIRTVLNELRPSAFRLLWRERADYGLTGLIPSFGPFKRGTYPLRFATEPPPGQFGYVAALNQALAALNLEAAAMTVDLPVLLAYGERDQVVVIRQGERLQKLIRGAELARVPRGTHLSTPLDPALIRSLTNWMCSPN